MGIFGAPIAQGDDALRAVRAAAEMLTEVEALNAEIESQVRRPSSACGSASTPAPSIVGAADRRALDVLGRHDERRRAAREARRARARSCSARTLTGSCAATSTSSRRARSSSAAAREPLATFLLRGATRTGGEPLRRPPAGRARARPRAAAGRLRALRRAQLVRVRHRPRRGRGRQVAPGRRGASALQLERDCAGRPVPALRRGDHLLATHRDRLAGGRHRGLRRRGVCARQARRRARRRSRRSGDRTPPRSAHRARLLVRPRRAGVLGSPAPARSARRAPPGDHLDRGPPVGRADDAGARPPPLAPASFAADPSGLHRAVRAARQAAGLAPVERDHDLARRARRRCHRRPRGHPHGRWARRTAQGADRRACRRQPSIRRAAAFDADRRGHPEALGGRLGRATTARASWTCHPRSMRSWPPGSITLLVQRARVGGGRRR